MNLTELGALSPIVAHTLDNGIRAWRMGQLEQAEAAFRAALHHATGSRKLSDILSARQLLGNLAYTIGALAEAYAQHQAVLEDCQAIGMQLGVASSLHNLGLIHAMRGDTATGVRLINRAISLYESLGKRESAATARANRTALIAGQLQG